VEKEMVVLQSIFVTNPVAVIVFDVQELVLIDGLMVHIEVQVVMASYQTYNKIALNCFPIKIYQ
jgi:hypothetical protein